MTSPSWLLSHLGAGLLLGGVLLLLLAAMRRASTAQRCWMGAIFLGVLALVTPWQARWWPDVRIPVLQTAPPQEATRSDTSSLPAQVIDLTPSHQARQAASMPQPKDTAQPLWQTLLLPLWAAGVAMLLLRLLTGAWLWGRLWSNAETADVSLPPHSPRAEIRFSSAIAGPLASGRKILLPTTWTQWTPEEQSAALAHELAHVRHRDGLSRWLAEVAVALHWPSPLVWLMRRELRLAQEQRCDEAVLATGVDAPTYGRLLVRCARDHAAVRGAFTTPLTAVSMARPGQLTRRLRHLAAVPATAPAPRLRHLVWPLILACVCLQGLHVRLVAEPAKKPASEGDKTNAVHQVDLLAIEVKFIESGSEVARQTIEATGRKQGKDARQLTDKQSNALLRDLLTLEPVHLTSYPRMVTLPGREVMIRSVVSHQDNPFTLDNLGKPGLYRTGTILSLTPSLPSGGGVRLQGTLGLNSAIREIREGHWEHDGQRADIAADLAPGDTLILGPFKPVDREAGKRRDTWVLISPALLSGKAEDQEQAAAKLRSGPAQVYELPPKSLDGLLTGLAQDAGIQFWMLPATTPGTKPPMVGLQETTAPFAAIESLCASHKLTLRLLDGIWTAGTQQQWNSAPAGFPRNRSEAWERLRLQRSQNYQFYNAGLGDVLRFLATDCSINWLSASEGIATDERPVTFRMNASPFAVMEKICEMNGLHLVNQNNIWCLTEHAEDEERHRKAQRLVGPEVEQLRDPVLSQQYDFHKARLGDVLRFLIKDAGLNAHSLPEDSPTAQRLVTFSIKASPFTVLETLCRFYNLTLVPKDGTWFIHESR